MIRKAAIALVICAGFFLAYRKFLIETKQWIGELRHAQYIDEAVRYQAFPLTTGESISFELRPRSQTLRVFANAALKGDGEFNVTLDSPRIGSRFSIDYMITDKDDRVLASSQYHFRARSKTYIHPETEELFNPALFGESSDVPSATRTMQLPIDEFDGNAAKLYLRLADQDPNIADVSFRVYCSSERPDYRDINRWKQLTQESRGKLTRASVYPEGMLTREERMNLMRIIWSPAAPIGKIGEDFDKRTIYLRNEVLGRELKSQESELGVNIDPDHLGTIPLPKSAKHVQIQLAPIVGVTDVTKDITCQLRWFGRFQFQREVREVVLRNGTQQIELPWRSGLIEIESTAPVIARVTAGLANEEGEAVPVEITPKLRATRTYFVPTTDDLRQSGETKLAALEYVVSHVGRQRSPLRISLRQVIDRGPRDPRGSRSDSDKSNDETTADAQVDHLEVAHPKVGVPGTVEWEFLDQDNQVIDSGTLQVNPTISKYERIRLSPGFLRVTQRMDYFFSVSSDVRRVRLRTKELPILATAYTRPVDAPRITLVPEDYAPGLHMDETGAPFRSKNRSWFAIQPREYLLRIKSDRSVYVRVQNKPPEDRPELLNGEYAFEGFEPNQFWTGRYFYVPRDRNAVTRDRALDGVFVEIPVGVTQEIDFTSPMGLDEVRPRLAYFGNDSDQDQQVSILIDGKVFHTARLRAREGEIEIPAIPVTDHPPRVTLQTNSAAEFLMNQQRPEGRNSHLKRIAHRLTSEPMTIEFTKRTAEDESLLIYVYQRQDAAQRAIFETQLVDFSHLTDTSSQHHEPQLARTLRRRRFHVAARKTNILLADTPEPLQTVAGFDAGQMCLFPLHSDLPAGKYQLRIQSLTESENKLTNSESAPEAFVAICSIVPGQESARRLTFETKEAPHE